MLIFVCTQYIGKESTCEEQSGFWVALNGGNLPCPLRSKSFKMALKRLLLSREEKMIKKQLFNPGEEQKNERETKTESVSDESV